MQTITTIEGRILQLEIEVETLLGYINDIDSLKKDKYFAQSVYFDLISRRADHVVQIDKKLSIINNLRDLSDNLQTPLIIQIWI
jgi:hypothetical protein